jgi:poly [ADP-ribose] polymerase
LHCFRFSDKTGNKWEDRKNFQKKAGKYQLVEIDYNDTKSDEEEAEEEKKKKEEEKKKKQIKIPDSNLPKRVQQLISLICDVRQLNSAMMELEIDVKRMPLGKLSKLQIKKGYEILKEIEQLLNSGAPNAKFIDCSNRFYTLIPHAFGFKAPPIINNLKLLQSKLDMLEVSKKEKGTF